MNRVEIIGTIITLQSSDTLHFQYFNISLFQFLNVRLVVCISCIMETIILVKKGSSLRPLKCLAMDMVQFMTSPVSW